jgi:hypothetical protein
MEFSTEQLVPSVDLASTLNLAEDTPDRLRLYSKSITESIAQYKVSVYSNKQFAGLNNNYFSKCNLHT